MHFIHSKWIFLAAGAVGASLLKVGLVRQAAGKALDTIDSLVNSDSAREIRQSSASKSTKSSKPKADK